MRLKNRTGEYTDRESTDSEEEFSMRRILAAALCALLLLTAAGCKKEQQAAPVLAETLSAEAGMRNTILYYQEASGLIVPAMKAIPWEEGIGKAALGNLTASAENSEYAQSLGLEPTVPEGVEFGLRILDGGAARVDLRNLPALSSAQQERNLVTSVVNTLMEFSSVNTVQILIEGKELETLPQGMDISRPFGRISMNPETLAVMGGDSGGNTVELYFPNQEGTLNVPVTRSLEEEPTLQRAIEELLKGPAQTDALQSCFPAGTELLGVTVERGVAIVDFSREFENICEYENLSVRAVETLALTCESFGVPSVQIRVEGKDWDAAVIAPLYANRFAK